VNEGARVAPVERTAGVCVALAGIVAAAGERDLLPRLDLDDRPGPSFSLDRQRAKGRRAAERLVGSLLLLRRTAFDEALAGDPAPEGGPLEPRRQAGLGRPGPGCPAQDGRVEPGRLAGRIEHEAGGRLLEGWRRGERRERAEVGRRRELLEGRGRAEKNLGRAEGKGVGAGLRGWTQRRLRQERLEGRLVRGCVLVD